MEATNGEANDVCKGLGRCEKSLRSSRSGQNILWLIQVQAQCHEILSYRET